MIERSKKLEEKEKEEEEEELRRGYDCMRFLSFGKMLNLEFYYVLGFIDALVTWGQFRKFI